MPSTDTRFGPWVWVAALLVASTVAGWLGWRLAPEPAPAPTTRLSFPAPGQAPDVTNFVWVVLSPDGRTLAFAAYRDGFSQLYTRSLGELDITPVRGSEGAVIAEAFSPDGEWLLYSEANGQALKKIPVSGGQTVTLGITNTFQADWGSGDVIVQGSENGARVVDAAGGVLDTLDPEAVALNTPSFLPSRDVLFSIGRASNTKIGVLSLETGERTNILTGSSPVYLDPGYVLFTHEGVLWATRFDVRTQLPVGEPVPVLEDLEIQSAGFANFDAAGGNLAYVPSSATTEARSQVVMVDRDGNERDLPIPIDHYRYPRVTPDGSALGLGTMAMNEDLHRWDLQTGEPTRLTFEPGADTYSSWLPDGDRFVYSATLDDDTWDIFLRSSASGTAPTRLGMRAATQGARFPSSVSPDGRLLVYRVGISSNLDLWIMPIDDPDSAQPLLDSEHDELQAQISPDGRWLAFTSDEPGQREVFVTSFPDVGRFLGQISVDGGESPTWSRSSDEIFFQKRHSDGSSSMMVAAYEVTDAVLERSTPTLLFEGKYRFGYTGRNYDVMPDGQHFVLIKPWEPPEDQLGEIVVVQDFVSELDRRFAQN